MNSNALANTLATEVHGQYTDIVYFRVEVTDLWRDGDGWTGNYSWVRRYLVPVAAGSRENAIARKIKRVAGIQGMRKDYWAGENCWRDGCVGAHAYIDFNYGRGC